METYTKSPTDLSMDDIRLNFPHDLTGYVTRSDQYAFASGSFGDVFRGMFNVRGKLIEVAIKVYKVYTQRDEHRLKRFNKEIDVWLKLQHPNVLPLFGTIRDTRMHPDIPAMVCPWVANGSLSGHLDRNKELPVTARLILINDVALGLQYLHSQRVVHGDLSGSNVLVRADGRAYIADFGLSTLLTAVGGPSVASSRQNGGTVRWMAPELLNPQNPSPPSPTSRSDVYSFGSIMFQTLTGNIPYHHLSRDEQVIWAILQGTKPDRPSYKALTNGRWTFIERCWSSGGGRPSSDKIVEFTSRDLAESMAGRI
ncbi:Protein kinase-like domain containing protein [Tylopilus felleus]